MTKLQRSGVAVATSILLAATAAPAGAAGPTASTSSLHNACSAKNGALRLLSKKGRCRKGEKPLALWIGSAPAGPKGATGATGATGPKGATGPAGSPDSPNQVLAKLLGVDGAGSGLDADRFDGLDSGAFQRRGSTTSCAPGQVVTAISAAGDVSCAADADTTYTAGSGLTLTGTSFSLDTASQDARYKQTCPTLKPNGTFPDGATVWTGTVCLMKVPDTFQASWANQAGWCANASLYGYRGRIATYAEDIAAAKAGLITLTVGEWTADSGPDDSAVYINGTDSNNADGIRTRATTGSVRCAFAPLQAAALGAPARPGPAVVR